MRIFITGIAGFIGSHLAERLVSQGHKVYGIDVKSWIPPVGVVYYRCDCRHYPKLKYIISECNPDFIYHLAATVGVKKVIDNPQECIENNIDSLKAILNIGVPGLFTSTSEVYGKSDNKLSEDSDMIFSGKVRWNYATSKLIGEWLAKASGWKSVRLFNVIGPRQNKDYGAVVPRFVKQILDPVEKGTFTIYGNGNQIRTFIDVRDCVEILDRLRDEKFDVVNVGGLNVMSIKELAATIWSVFYPDRVYSLKFLSYESVYGDGFEECFSRIPDLTKLDSLLPVRPASSFKKTIIDIEKYLQEQSKPVAEQKEYILPRRITNEQTV